MQCYVNVSSHWPIRTGFLELNRELKQSSYGTATTVNQQLNYRVKRNPQTLRLPIAYVKDILWLKVCERTVLTILKVFR